MKRSVLNFFLIVKVIKPSSISWIISQQKIPPYQKVRLIAKKKKIIKQNQIELKKLMKTLKTPRKFLKMYFICLMYKNMKSQPQQNGDKFHCFMIGTRDKQ